MKTRNKQTKDEPKEDLYKKTYSTSQNVWYVLMNAIKSDKVILPLLLTICICDMLQSYIWSFFSKIVIDQVSIDQEFGNFIQIVLIIAMVQFIVLFASDTGNARIWWRFIRARMNMIQLRIKKCLEMDFELLESPKLLDIHQKALDATGGNNNGVEGTLHTSRHTITAFLKIIVSGILVISLNKWMLLSVTLMGILNYVVNDVAKKKYRVLVWDWLAPFWRKKNYFDYGLADFNMAKDIRIFSMKEWLMNKYIKINDIMHKREKLSTKIWQISGTISNFIVFLQEIVMYLWLVNSVLHDEMSIGNFVFYLSVVATFFNGWNGFLSNITEFRKLSREINDFRTFVEYPDQEENIIKIPIPKSDKYNIVFENVSFKYKNSEHYAIKNMNLTLKSGDRLAVVGLNGAGKTTFVKLLCRLYQPSEGRILLNGVDIKFYGKEEYYSLFAPLFQNVMTYAFPVSENVSMSPPDITDRKRAEECLRLAGFGEKLDILKYGVQTELMRILYDDGIDLSGGEKQKLALARALYKGAPVIILDEPTSALDALAEYELYQNFDQLIGNSTAVYISHRLSSTRFCDNIAMFADGSLVEYGSHEELMIKGGEYCKLFEVQAQYYKDAEETAYA